jgi:hypothetical protein
MKSIRRRPTIISVTAIAVALVLAQPAQAAPYWCRAWQVSGQTWYAYQSNGFSLLFTLSSAPGSKMFGGYARFNRGDVNRGGTPSQFIRGGVDSEGVGRIMMNIVWANGRAAQYHATAVNVRRGRSGILTAGLSGTTVDTTGDRAHGAAKWHADGGSSGLGTSGGRELWPLYCPREHVVQYPG